MSIGEALIELTRGDRVESVHCGHVVMCDASGRVLGGTGTPDHVIYPRSAAKMIQALPLAIARPDTAPERLALACASHNGDRIHRTRVADWLGDLGLGEQDLLCGAPQPYGQEAKEELIRNAQSPCQLHSDCSGKHTGFLEVAQIKGQMGDYLDITHPVQAEVKTYFEDVTQEASPGWGIDGCSAPNHATTLRGLATAMAQYATATDTTVLGAAQVRLRQAMIAHPDMVAGAGRSCTDLMHAAPGTALKYGAEAVYAAMIPQKGVGIAIKVTDGAARAAQAAMAHCLIKLDLLDPAHPTAAKYVGGPIVNFRDIPTGRVRATFSLS